jgi:hypothetical protein
VARAREGRARDAADRARAVDGNRHDAP